MAQDQHKNLTTGDLHECKGAAAAALGTYPKSDGAGSTVWTNPITAVKNANYLTLCGQFTNISAAGSSIWVTTPLAGKIVVVHVTLQNAITVANNTITVRIAGVTCTGGTITVPFAGSAAGSVSPCSPSALNSITANSAIEIRSDGASTTACVAYVTITLDVS